MTDFHQQSKNHQERARNNDNNDNNNGGGGGGGNSTTAVVVLSAKAPLHTAPDCSPPALPPPVVMEAAGTTARAMGRGSTASSVSREPSPMEREAKRKAAARAYALSGTTNEGKNYKRKLSMQSPANANANANSSSPHPRTQPRIPRGVLSRARPEARGVPNPPPHKRPKTNAAATPPPTTAATATVTATAARNTGQKSKTIQVVPKAIPAGPNVVPPPATTATATATATATRKQQLPPRPVAAAAGRTRQPLRAPSVVPPTRASRSAVVVAGGPLAASTRPGDTQPPAHTSAAGAPVRSENYDPEYLKMIQSLGELDDFSIWDALDNVEDEEFRLSDIDDDEEEFDGEDDDGEENHDRGDAGTKPSGTEEKAGIVVPGTPGTSRASNGTTTPASIAVPLSPNTVTNASALTPSQPTVIAIGSSPSLDLPGWDDQQEDGGEFYKNLEEELGSLLEEELEAAVKSLYTTKGAAANAKEDNAKKRKGKKPLTKKQQQQNTFVATTTANAGSGVLTPVTAATLAAEAKRKEQAAKGGSNRGTPDTPLRETARQGNSATVTYRQSQQLRTLMRRHYQLLTQQAILSVRAAHSQKACNSGSHSCSLPPLPLSSKGTGAAQASARRALASGGGDFLCGENETDLTEILDLAVGMLQDLDQNRKDAIRTSIQLATSGGGSCNGSGDTGSRNSFGLGINSNSNNNTARGNKNKRNGNENGNGVCEGRASEESNDGTKPKGAQRSLLSQFSEGHEDTPPWSKSRDKNQQENDSMVASQSTPPSNQGGGRLTRAAFRKLQAQPIVGSKRTAFDIPGLPKLEETFSTIDDSVNVHPTKGPVSASGHHSGDGKTKKVNILEAATHSQACRDVLKDAGANVEEALLPGVLDVSENFSQLEEHLGDDFQPPCSMEQEQFLRKNRNLFTSGEDNLVLRGVNLYGEKQWILIGDRYLPDRSINIISQRYSKLCVMLYKAHGIHVDTQGNLLEPPKLESVDDIDENRVKAMGLKLVDPPAILNVHRWSMEEDLTILKAVPIMGHMWAELGARLIPHRDRGHLRKRYQVLERRVKATITRGFKAAAKARNATKNSARSSFRGGATKNRNKIPAKSSLTTVSKATIGTAATKAGPKATAMESISAKARSSPGRGGKKSNLAARSTVTADAKKTTTKSSPVKGKTTAKDDAAKGKRISPMMSLESAAASLACIKPNETEKQANIQSTATVLKNIRTVPNPETNSETRTPSTKLPMKSTAKRTTLQRVSASGGTTTGVGKATKQLPSTTVRKSTPYAHPPALTPDTNNNNKNYSMAHPGDHHLHGPGNNNLPHPHPLHPHYPYHYHGYPGYYHPAYQYPPHHPLPPQPSTEKNESHPLSTKNTPPSGAKSYYPKPNFSAESKRVNPAPQKPSSTRPLGKETDIPSNKSLISSIVGDNLETLYGADADTSQQAYEKLFEFIGENGEWSQNSKMKKFLENEDEIGASNAIVGNMAKSPGLAGTGLLSNFLGDSNSNLTGLSLLNEISKQPTISKDFPNDPGISIMARVLGETSGNPKQSSGHDSETVASPTKNSAGSSSPASDPKSGKIKMGNNNTGSLLRDGSTVDAAAAAVAPQTPQKDPSPAAFFSTTGTPVGLSPGLRTLGASALLKNDGIGATNLSVTFSPGPSGLLKGEGLATNLSMPYSPAPSILYRAFDEKTGDENRFMFDQDSRVCEDSNQLGDLAVGADLSNTAANPNNGNSLIIAPDEFDAISGLGALSNSPFKAVKSLSRRDDEKNRGSDKKKKKSKSFFARVVGDSKERSPQKKLKF